MSSPLMVAYSDGDGDFKGWLKKLGVSDTFTRSYPLVRLVQWGWLRPQYRVVFPAAYFMDDTREAEAMPTTATIKNCPIDDLVANQWLRDRPDEPMWFIHPFFRPQTEVGRLLRQNSAKTGLPEVPEPINQTSGNVVAPYADYYFPWQGLALLDVIRHADCFHHYVLDTPDVQAQIDTLARLAKPPSGNPHEYLALENQWGGLADVMTWLAHYAQLGGAIERHEVHYGPVPGMFQLGARSLAAHLGFDAQRLEGLIKDRLLVTAQSWMSDVGQRNRWISSAYPFLQKEIYLAVEWLCVLTDKTLDYYFDLWRFRRMGNHSWAKLHAVLPFEYYGIRDTFLQLAPSYLKAFDQQLVELYRLNDDGLSEVVDVTRLNSRHFNSFMGAFKKLHDGLHRHRDPHVIDFRERQPLDYYLLLAIRAETCLREELRRVGTLVKIPDDKQSLGRYLREFGSKVGLDKDASEFL